MPSVSSRRGLAAFVGRPWFWAILLGTLFTLPLVRALRRQLPPSLPVLGRIDAAQGRWTWAAGEKTGQTYDAAAELSGRVWVAALVDPNDPPCEHLMKSLTEVQKRSKNLGDAYRIVTFVPEGNDREKITSFARTHYPNPWRWHFVFENEPILSTITRAMYDAGVLAAFGPPRPDKAHQRHLAALFDGRGQLRGFYDLTGKAGRDALLSDAGILANLPVTGPPSST